MERRMIGTAEPRNSPEQLTKKLTGESVGLDHK